MMYSFLCVKPIGINTHATVLVTAHYVTKLRSHLNAFQYSLRVLKIYSIRYVHYRLSTCSEYRNAAQATQSLIQRWARLCRLLLRLTASNPFPADFPKWLHKRKFDTVRTVISGRRVSVSISGQSAVSGLVDCSRR